MSIFGPKPTRTKKTDAEYRRMWAYKRFKAEHLETDSEPEWDWATEAFALQYFGGYKKRTIRKYIAAASAAARDVWGGRAADQCSEGFYAAKKKLKPRGRRRKPRTSDSKATFFPEGGIKAMQDGFRALNSDRGKFYMACLGLQYFTGCRPHELWSIDVFDLGPWTLVRIENAKTSNGRSHGRTRTLWFKDPNKRLRGQFLEFLDTLHRNEFEKVTPSKSRAVPLALLQARYCRAFARVSKLTFADMDRKPTPYTLRHQFAADCKHAGMRPTEIAAMMGHGVNNTVFNHYEHGRRGRARTHLPKADPQDMARVKDKFTPNPFAKKVAAPTLVMRGM